jgi:hypothetical protein
MSISETVDDYGLVCHPHHHSTQISVFFVRSFILQRVSDNVYYTLKLKVPTRFEGRYCLLLQGLISQDK